MKNDLNNATQVTDRIGITSSPARKYTPWTICLLIGSFVPIPHVRAITPVTCEERKAEVKSTRILGQKDKTGTLDFFPARVMTRLQQAEAHELNLHLKSDYRQAWITTSFAQKNVHEPFVAASYVIYGLHPDKVWPSVVADRKARLGAEYYDWYDSADILRPDIPQIPQTAGANDRSANGADLLTGTLGPVPTYRKAMQ
jgi:hypothetical protein